MPLVPATLETAMIPILLQIIRGNETPSETTNKEALKIEAEYVKLAASTAKALSLAINAHILTSTITVTTTGTALAQAGIGTIT